MRVVDDIVKRAKRLSARTGAIESFMKFAGPVMVISNKGNVLVLTGPALSHLLVAVATS